MLLITDDLARRLESAEALDGAGCAESQLRLYPGSGAIVKPIAGGAAVFCGSQSPLTHALGVGMHGAVTTKELHEIESFYRERDCPVVIDVCPHSDPTLRELLVQRGYRLTEFASVLVRTLPSEIQLCDIEVRSAHEDDEETYVRVVVGGFMSRPELNEEEVMLGRTLFHMPCTRPYLGFVEGVAAGGGTISTRNRVASLFADATLPEFRGRGVHTALIRARLKYATESGCELATAGTMPGSTSQRDYERLGFQVAYTKATMVLE